MRKEEERVGLCLNCLHGRRVVSAKASEFWRCAKADTDPRFPKYARLPVLKCDGYEEDETPSPLSSPPAGERGG